MSKEPRHSGKNRFNVKTLFFVLRLSAMIAMIHISSGLCAQAPGKLLEIYLQEVRAGRSPVLNKELVKSLSSMAGLATLEGNRKDSVAIVRARINTIEQQIAQNTQDKAIRQEAILRLIQACKDKDGGNAGQAIQCLTVFGKSDFTVNARDSVKSLFQQKTAHFDDLIKLTGFLELTDLKETIRPYTQPGNPQPVRWAAILSLARMNDGLAANDMIKRVRKHPVNDDVVYQLFPDLVYTRHPEAIAYMVEALNSDEKNCMTADAEREVPIPCGYRIMEQLAPIIEGYPVELDESGDIKTKDYVATLQKVREWFAKNKNYKILRDRY